MLKNGGNQFKFVRLDQFKNKPQDLLIISERLIHVCSW